MNSRTRAGVDATFTYNAENKLIQVVQGSTTIATFVYDADGTRVQATIAGVTTKYVGEYYEVTGTDVTKYYGGHTAMRKSGVVSYLLSDHLGSNSLIVDSTGAKVSESRYKAWGELRFSSGTISTDYTYTGQYSNTDDFGWMYYKARWYDPTLGRFAQADSIVPGAGNPLAWDRYAYVKNNPVRYTDPTGHSACWDENSGLSGCRGLAPTANGLVMYYDYAKAGKYAAKHSGSDDVCVGADCTRFISESMINNNGGNLSEDRGLDICADLSSKTICSTRSPLINANDQRSALVSLYLSYTSSNSGLLGSNTSFNNGLYELAKKYDLTGSVVYFHASLAKEGMAVDEITHTAMITSVIVDENAKTADIYIAEHSGPDLAEGYSKNEDGTRLINSSSSKLITGVDIVIVGLPNVIQPR